MARKVEYLLVDGYNIIYAWDSLKDLAADSLENARWKLMDILTDYNGSMALELIVVFDAHKVKGRGQSDLEQYNNIKVVYTKEAETADHYIERAAGKLAKDYLVKVATSDHLEQIIVIGRGAYRMSARELFEEIESNRRHIRERYIESRPVKNNLLLDNLDAETAAALEKMRRQT